MPNQDPHSSLPLISQHVNGGADTDTELEILGTNTQGLYYDSKNGRPTDHNGKSLSHRRIHGEVQIYSNTNGNFLYECIGSCYVEKKIIEIWASPNGGEPIITIDGLVVLRSNKFPALIDHHYQIATNPNCVGGEFYITDFNTPPIYFNVQDMIDNALSGSQKYFTDFNVDEFTVNLIIPGDFPVFDDLVDMGAGGGLPVGQYAYAIRYSTSSGDRTGWSAMTPLIFVPNYYEFGNDESGGFFPFVKTRGAIPAPTEKTNYGVKIRFRVNNKLNYDFVEVVRVKYNGGEAFGFVPDAEIVKKIDIEDGEFSVKEFIDSTLQSEAAPESIPVDESLGYLSVIKRAKGIRYFKRRVVLMNIEYESRDLDAAGITFMKFPNTNLEMTPFTEYMNRLPLSAVADEEVFTQETYNYALNHAYKKPYLNGERHGFAVIFRDTANQVAFALPVPNFGNFQFPNRRDAMNADAKSVSYSPVHTTTVDNTVDDTYECWTNRGRIKPGSQDVDALHNILNDGRKNGVEGDDFGYHPFRPVSLGDANTYQNRITSRVFTNNGNEIDYNPPIYGYAHHALGIALRGVQNIPSWVSSMSVVRTRAAGRIVAQGLGFWKLEEFAGGGSFTKKKKDMLTCYFPDFQSAAQAPDVLTDMKNNPNRYQIQVVCPAGFCTDVYSFDALSGGGGAAHDKKIDMVSFCNVVFEQDGGTPIRFNPGEPASNIGVQDDINPDKYHVAFGKWRNPATSGWFAAGGANNGNKIWNVTAVADTTTEKENVLLQDITLDSNLYDESDPGAVFFDSAGTRRWHEPVYVINIIRDGAVVPDSNITEYLETGTTIKIKSQVGISDGNVTQVMSVVDERIEDFHKAPLDVDDKYIYVKDGSVYKAWINVNYMNPIPAAILADIAGNGGGTSYNGTPLYGVYTSTKKKITFPLGTSVPSVGSEVYVFYDDRFPIKTFGGDSMVGDAVYPILHRDNDSQFPNAAGLPYHQGHLNTGIFIVNDTTGVNKIQNQDTWDLGNCQIRQWLTMFICQSRSHLPLAFSDANQSFFPQINYVMRPNNWNDDTPSNQNIFSEYETDYPNEELRWAFGGFRWIQLINLDYSKEFNKKTYFSKPKVGFVDRNHFCNRVIWSLQRETNEALHPGIKTFRPFNYRDISDNYEEIKYAFDAYSDKADNLYAFCGRGICLLLTDKRTLSSLTGDDLAVIGEGDTSLFVQEEIWVEKMQGVPDELWRTIAEDSNMAYYANYNSVFHFENNNARDIGDYGYKNKLYNKFLKRLDTGFKNKVAACHDTKYDEYWLLMKIIPIKLQLTGDQFAQATRLNLLEYEHDVFDVESVVIDTLVAADSVVGSFVVRNTGTQNLIVISTSTLSQIVTLAPGQWARVTYDGTNFSFVLNPSDVEFEYIELLVFSRKLQDQQRIGRWIGEFDYQFDKFVSFDSKTFGSRSLKTFKLDEGYTINGANINYKLWNAANFGKDEQWGKEFVRIRVNTNRVKPTTIDFHNREDFNIVVGRITSANINELRDYLGFEQYVPRQIISRDRMQDMFLMYSINFNGTGEFQITSVTFKYLNLK